MTLQWIRTTVVSLGETGALLVLGACGVGLAALLVTVAPMTTNAGVMLAFVAGLVGGNVAWAWITSTPLAWRHPARYSSRRRATLELVVGLVIGFVLFQGLQQFFKPIFPTQRVAEIRSNGGIFYEDIPENAVIWLAVLWLVLLVLEVPAGVGRRIVRSLWRSPDAGPV